METSELATMLEQNFKDVNTLKIEVAALKIVLEGMRQTLNTVFQDYTEISTLHRMAFNPSLLKKAEKKAKAALKKLRTDVKKTIKDHEKKREETGPGYEAMGAIEVSQKFMPKFVEKEKEAKPNV